MVVKPLEAEPLSSIIQVVYLNEQRPIRAEVLAIGPKVKWGTKVGDVVQFTDILKFPELIDHGTRVLILQEADVCFVEEAA